MPKKTTSIMGFGTFDVVHPGHLFYLEALSKIADEVFITVARDENVLKIKGRMPKYNQQKRSSDIKATGLVAKVCLGHSTDFYQCIRDFNPDFIGLGYDQKADEPKLKKLFPDIQIFRISAFKPDTYKSSLLNS